MRPWPLAAFAVALVLHLYENLAKTDQGFSAGWLAWQMLPYVLALALSRARSIGNAVFPAMLMALGFDAITHYEVFIAPTSSTAAIALVWGPLWNTILVIPLATGLAVLFARMRRRAIPPPA
jgi:hypothetical protein